MTANEKEYELGFWGDCCNTFHEETKQWVYARLMGIRREHWSLRVYGASIIDIGGGPVSMLLKCHDLGHGSRVVDPLAYKYPSWTVDRYGSNGIYVQACSGEDLSPLTGCSPWAECWIYNVLQHVDDPQLVLKNALAVCRKLRIFEWVNVPACEGHPHELKAGMLDMWLHGVSAPSTGNVVPLSYEGCFGDAYVNVVPGLAR